MNAPSPSSSLLLLGEQFGDYGRVHLEAIPAAGITAAISAGASPNTPALRSKGSPDVPNEDGLLARCEGPRVLLAVADAHFGHRASHDLLRALDTRLDRIPLAPQELADLIESIPLRESADRSESTLLVVVLDRKAGQGFGYSFGDSALAVVGPERAEFLSRPRTTFVALRDEVRPLIDEAESLLFFTRPQDLLLLFTDGIHECHYGSPSTSVGTAQLQRCYASCGNDPRSFAQRLTQLAMRGVGGHPGGQDNIALLVSSCTMEAPSP